MGLFDFFGGGTPAEKAERLKAKATQKYGDAAARQKALQQLIDLKHVDAVPVLMQRFTFVVDPQTTDNEEKQHVFTSICELKEGAVPGVRSFLVKNDKAVSWALKVLDAVLPAGEALQIVTDELKRLGVEYTRDPEKKEVLLHSLDGKQDERIGPVVVPFLHDMSDDVKMAALKTISSIRFEGAREPLLQLLTTEDTARRVQTACLQTLVETGFPVQGFREKVEARLGDGFTLDKAGVVKKRGG